MVQEFMILRCFSCTTFQVHQVSNYSQTSELNNNNKNFGVRHKLIYCESNSDHWLICLPTLLKGKEEYQMGMQSLWREAIS